MEYNIKNQFKLSNGDRLKYRNLENNKEFYMIIGTHINKYNGMRSWSMLGRNKIDESPKEIGEKQAFAYQHGPIVLLQDTDKDSIHPKETINQAVKKMANDYPKYKFLGGTVKQAKIKQKFSNFPYKRIKSLTNSAKRPHMNYEIVQGELLDKDLIKKAGTKNVYYLKALRDFKVNVNHSAAQIKKNMTSGPIVLSSNKIVKNDQSKALREAANSRSEQNRKLHVKGRKQNFWLDQDSILKGNWHMPDSALLIHSKVDIASSPKQKMTHKGGISLENTVLDHSEAIGKTKQIILKDSKIKTAMLGGTESHSIFVFNSNITDSTINANSGNDLIDNSKLQNTSLNKTNIIKNTIKKREIGKMPLYLENENLDAQKQSPREDRKFKLEKSDFDINKWRKHQEQKHKDKGLDL